MNKQGSLTRDELNELLKLLAKDTRKQDNLKAIDKKVDKLKATWNTIK